MSYIVISAPQCIPVGSSFDSEFGCQSLSVTNGAWKSQMQVQGLSGCLPLEIPAAPPDISEEVPQTGR